MPEVGGLTGPPPGPAPAALPSAGSRGAAALALGPGDLVSAALVEALGGGEGIVEVEGRLLRALYPEGLAPGTRLTLRVVSTGPPLLLRIPDAGQEALAKLLGPPSQGLGSVVRGLLAAAAPPQVPLLEGADVLRLPPTPAELAPALARLLEKSGLFHEASLARGQDPDDLKSLALRILARPAEASLTRLAEALLGHIEAYQARSSLEGTASIPFVLPWGADHVQGEWVIEERTGQGPGGQAASGALRLRLQMPALGPVEVALRWGPAGTAVRLRASHAAAHALSHRLEELRASLSEAPGVRLLDLALEPLGQVPPARVASLLEVVA